jgi:hypothetical protein
LGPWAAIWSVTLGAGVPRGGQPKVGMQARSGAGRQAGVSGHTKVLGGVTDKSMEGCNRQQAQRAAIVAARRLRSQQRRPRADVQPTNREAETDTSAM